MKATVVIEDRRFDDIEDDIYLWALERFGSVRAAARALGLSKSTLANRVARRRLMARLPDRPPPGGL